ncbi:protein of unknown function (plasmid) [Cupriavidus taiwanensis]|uniref:Uncharacterized protein n=1 Tax=Cupriavidus taiwanensis TaxID=164546 RepID=A0A375HIU2_9BURK|nr:hypothetical protein CBM2592_B180043 [Cupriavidus taiwanensis]SOY69831.1 hypothetical protein CBM2588_B200043 [Cupriavidus taiwanensis]SOY95287.1 hypothetical protein CBM2591_B170043 [Cupriavidus taiwanensis]SOZ71915.1 hypothetical protein CBM2617_B180252 [Cupriavidus taiwanensis]SOZ87217.1 hypothetical protein CBM2618_B200249 [Cupriavidus taiwanensis]
MQGRTRGLDRWACCTPRRLQDILRNCPQQEIARHCGRRAWPAFFSEFHVEFSNKCPLDLINLPAIFRLQRPAGGPSIAAPVSGAPVLARRGPRSGLTHGPMQT